MSIAQIAEGCRKVLLDDKALASLVAVSTRAAHDAHAIVKWSACQAIGQVCTGVWLLQRMTHVQPQDTQAD
jgi:importin-5